MNSQQAEVAVAPQQWSTEDSARLYGIPYWGQGYFEAAADGHLHVRPYPQGPRSVDLFEVVEGLRARDIAAPVVIRFSDILAHRLAHMAGAFQSAISENEYKGRYIAVYPIKVNQQRHVVEEVYKYGAEHGFGLEVGSKPELLAVMALTGDAGERPIICNGFKDDDYLEAVILATKLGRNIIPVIEKADELDRIVAHARQYKVRPKLGVRVKLAAEGAGRWKESAGVKSKFGLFVSEVVALVDRLREEDMLDCLELVHCHTGSQLHDIRRIKNVVGELAHVYASLCAMGAALKYIDVGGGLGVDYDGSGANHASSMNYSIEEYAADVVYRVGTVCDAHDLPHPTIISESGRAIAAYSSVLVMDVLGSSRLEQKNVPPAEQEDEPQPIIDLRNAIEDINPERLLECYHDAMQAHSEALQMFALGYLDLRQRALAERIYWACCARIRDMAKTLEEPPEELAELTDVLSDIYFCNFSVFQSVPDAWAIDQLFPIAPIHRLEQEPTREAVLADITCDSDGKLDRFVSGDGERSTLPVHELHDQQRYYLGVFLVGAYQETLGDLHNLFGDTHVVHIHLTDDGGWWIDEVVHGDTAAELLGYMQFDPSQLFPAVARDCERAVREGRMSVDESRALRRFFDEELRGYAYLEP